jgi:hypothetical protein
MPAADTGFEGVGDVVAHPLEAPEDTVWEVDADPADETARLVETAEPVEDNSHAGQGSVVLDIGGEIGALVLQAPAELEGVEIEIRPTGDTPYADGHPAGGDHPHADDHHDDHDDGHHHDDHDHGHHHDGHDGHDGGHSHGSGSHPGGTHRGHKLLHVAVLRRPSPAGAVYAAVYPSLHEGTYELYRRPAEPVAMTVVITGSQVTEARWPDGR